MTTACIITGIILLTIAGIAVVVGLRLAGRKRIC